MPRTFDGANDSLHASIGAMSGFNGGGNTFVIVSKRNQTAVSAQITLHNNAGGSICGLEILSNANGNIVEYQAGANFAQSAFTVVNADGWVLIAGGKASGTLAPRFHKYLYSSNTWTHQDGAAIANGAGTPGASGTVRWGEWEGVDDFAGDIAAAACFDRKLTDTEVEQMPHSLAVWLAMAPVGMWVFDQAATAMKLNDWAGGGANESALVGTTVSTNSGPIGYGADVSLSTSAPAAGAPATSALAPRQRPYLLAVR